MIQIKRIYLNLALEVEVLINERYIIRIEPVMPHEDIKPRTRIVMEGWDKDGGASIIYTNEILSSLKGKISKSRK